jgi:tRNA G18 (ribose-2'-O)-methylase SpoU
MQIRIPDLDDSRLAPFRQLKETNATRREGLFICEGEKLTRRLLASDFSVASLLVAERLADAFGQVNDAVPVFVVADDWIEQIIGFNFHRGVLGCGRRRAMPTVEQLCEKLPARATLAMLPDVQDPENLGSILRICSAFGIDGVLLGPKTADPFSRRVLRVSMGASLRVPLALIGPGIHELELMRQKYSFEGWATVLDDTADRLGAVLRPERLVICFGSEGHGLESELIAACERCVTIPMAPGVDSLNVSVAAGIFLYELVRPNAGRTT